jgi:hypothetical protein
MQNQKTVIGGSDSTVCSSASVVPFGKHKGQTIDRMVRDKAYTAWLLKQSWFRQHKIYQCVVDEVNRRYQTTIGIPEVYFVINEQMTRLKIGTSINPAKRLRSIQTGNADSLVIYGTILGDRHFEKQLHDEFAQHRLNGEWFVFAECKPRIDELLGKDREVARNKKYSLWEFRLITGLTEDQVKQAEWLGSKEGIGSYGCAGDWDNPNDASNTLRSYGGDIRGWVWHRIVESGCLRKMSN